MIPGEIQAVLEGRSKFPVSEWHGCYDDSWNGAIVPEAFAHPAKFSNGLIRRIIKHGLAQGYWREGDTVGDPFGGVALGGIIAGYYGLNWVGVELEERFCRMGAGYDCPGISKAEWVRWYNRFARNKDICPHCQARAQNWYEQRKRASGLFLDGGIGVIPSLAPHRYAGNIELHQRKWAAKGYDVDVRMVQGDSRRFAEIVGQVSAAVTSPPFTEDQPCASQTRALKDYESFKCGGVGAQKRTQEMQSPGQIGRLRAGEVQAVITSPPYAESIKGDHAERETAEESRAKRNTPGGSTGKSCRFGGYGASEGNIGNLKEGRLDAAITSPPYDENSKHDHTHNQRDDRRGFRQGRGCHRGSENYGETPGQIGNLSGGSVEAVVTSPPWEDQLNNHDKGWTPPKATPGVYQADYGATEGQIGNSTGETYWQAMRAVYEQMRLALKPGGVAAVVVKDYVKGGKRVPLCDDTLKLLVALGFEPLERVHAMLVKETVENTLFEGEVVKTKSRKSFFRRLCEAKGSPKIDWEEVLFVRKSVDLPNTRDTMDE